MRDPQSRTEPLARYVPKYLSEWDVHSDGPWRAVDGTLVYVDISGFTALSERLARQGRIGAEELTEVLDFVFAKMLGIAYDRQGSLLKFGGDALLLVFTGPDHELQACSAAVEMQGALRDARSYRTSSGRLRLKMSVGIHSGPVDLFRVGGSHRELIITGPTASITTRMEETAVAGEIVVSDATRAALPAGSAPVAKGDGWLLTWRNARVPIIGPTPRSRFDPAVMAEAMPVALRDFLRDGAAEPEHHIATVAFVRYNGVDRVMSEAGPPGVAGAVGHLIGVVQRAVDDAGVTFLATDIDQDGGKIILVAGVPEVQEDDAGRVLRATRRIIDDMAGADLAVKLGVNQGHVFVGDIGTEYRATYTIMGDTVNTAARLMAAARPGTVYASTSAVNSSNTLFETEVLEPFAVKGKKAPLQAYAIGPPTGPRTQQMGQLPLTGRDRELARLHEAVADLAAGKGSVITITGERGVGKTRLVRELLPALDAALHVEIRCEAHESTTPYRPIRGPVRGLLQVGRDPAAMAQALRESVESIAPEALPYLPLIGEVAMIPVDPTPEVDAIEPRFRQARTADLLADLLAKTVERPILFHVEDANFMDEASSHVMRRIAEATHRHPWFVLTTSRAGMSGGFDPGGEVLELGPLPESAVRELVHRATEGTPLRTHDVDAIVHRSGGLPLFLEEVLRVARSSGGTEDLPDSVEALVSAEIDELPPLSRRLLRFASVLGQNFWTDALRELVAPENVRLDAATRRLLADFLDRDGPDRLRFRHAVIRDVAYGGLAFKRRRELHLRAGEAAERAAGSSAETVAADLAFHFSLANDHERAWKYSRLAADRAAAAYANVDAAVHYRRALEAARRIAVEPDVEATVLTSLGDCCELAGIFDQALDSYRRASRLIPNEMLRRAELHLKSAAVRRQSGAYRSALRELTGGLRLVEEQSGVDADRIKARIAAERGAIRRNQQRPRDTLRAAEIAERHARSAQDLATLGRALDLIYWAHRMVGDTDREAPYEETLPIYESLGDLGRVASVWNNIGADAFYSGRWNEAVDAYRRSSEAERRSGNEVGAAISDANIAEIFVHQRRYDEAEPILDTSLRVLRASQHAPGAAFVESELARSYVRRGDHERGEKLLLELRDRSVAAGEDLNALNATLLLAEVRLLDGRPLEALAMCDDGRSHAGELAELFGPTIERLRALALSDLGRFDEAFELIDTALRAARSQQIPFDEAMLLQARIRIAAAIGISDPRDEAELHRLERELGMVPGR